MKKLLMILNNMAKLECSDEQLRLIQDALELYSRIGIMQIDHILYHPSVDKLLHNQFTENKELEVGDKTTRGKIVEINDKSIKTESFWSDWRDRADEETIKNNPEGWVKETREWFDIENIKLSCDYNGLNNAKDEITKLCSDLKNLISGDQQIYNKNASYGIGRMTEGEHNIIAYDMIQVIRHEFWKSNPNRSNMTADSSICKFGSKSLIKVEL